MPVPEQNSPYPEIDIDPHFRRVIQNFRQSDYLTWGAATATFPGILYFMEQIDPTRPPRGGLGSALRLGTFLGACGGFLMAYQRSSFRLWGWSENAIEVKRAEEQGNSAPGLDTSKSDMTPYMQGVAHRNSLFSQLKFSTIPWFNLANHPHHGKGVQKEGEESSE